MLDHRQAEAATVDRGVRRPQPHLAHLGLNAEHGGLQDLGIAVQELALQWQHLATHEVVDHRQHHRHLLRRFEIHHDLQ